MTILGKAAIAVLAWVIVAFFWWLFITRPRRDTHEVTIDDGRLW